MPITTTTARRAVALEWSDRIFPGFYESLLDEALTHEARETITYSPAHHDVHPDAETPGTPVYEAATVLMERLDWRPAMRYVAREWAREACHEVGLPCRFPRLESPAFYNFSSDYIIFYAPAVTWTEWAREAIARYPETVAAVLKDALTPYDGFIPHYSAHLSEWHPNPAEWSPAQCSLIIEARAACEASHRTDADAYTADRYRRGDRPQQDFSDYIYETLHVSGTFNDAVHTAISHAIKHDATFRDTWNRLARLTGRDAA